MTQTAIGDVKTYRREAPITVVIGRGFPPDDPFAEGADVPEYRMSISDDFGGPTRAVKRDVRRVLEENIGKPRPDHIGRGVIAVAIIDRHTIPSPGFGTVDKKPGPDWDECGRDQTHWIRDELLQVAPVWGLEI